VIRTGLSHVLRLVPYKLTGVNAQSVAQFLYCLVASEAGRDGSADCFYCLGSGYHFIGSIDEEGKEIVETYPCRHCQMADGA
jgi:hypothetical protein